LDQQASSIGAQNLDPHSLLFVKHDTKVQLSSESRSWENKHVFIDWMTQSLSGEVKVICFEEHRQKKSVVEFDDTDADDKETGFDDDDDDHDVWRRYQLKLSQKRNKNNKNKVPFDAEVQLIAAAIAVTRGLREERVKTSTPSQPSKLARPSVETTSVTEALATNNAAMDTYPIVYGMKLKADCKFVFYSIPITNELLDAMAKKESSMQTTLVNHSKELDFFVSEDRQVIIETLDRLHR
jgi:hypothetical protein